jgi:hypothetical protein
MPDLLVEHWREAARDLGLNLEAPFVLLLPSGGEVPARLLLRHFGAAHGMIVVTDFEAIRCVCEQVVAAGYGFSTLSEPRPGERYDRESFITMLRDWDGRGRRRRGRNGARRSMTRAGADIAQALVLRLPREAS